MKTNLRELRHNKPTASMNELHVQAKARYCPGMTIRRLWRKDIAAAADIVRRNYSKHYARLATIELQDMFGRAAIKPTYFVAVEAGEVVGFAGCMQSWMDYHIYTVFWVNVLPEKQRQGIGKALLAKVIATLKKKHASMAILTTKTPAYYKNNFGFTTLARLDGQSHLMALSF